MSVFEKQILLRGRGDERVEILRTISGADYYSSLEWFKVRSQPKRTIRNLPDPKIHPSAVQRQKNMFHAKLRKTLKQVLGYRYAPFTPKQE